MERLSVSHCGLTSLESLCARQVIAVLEVMLLPLFHQYAWD
jgi:GrpB-like predicted nucleotidyltransferase (UPF0157 family)